MALNTHPKTPFKARGMELVAGRACNFELLTPVDNETLIARYLAAKGEAPSSKQQEKLAQFVAQSMGIERRYHCSNEVNALDLGRDALKQLLEDYPEAQSADFLIFASISNPLPTVCTSALLAGEFELDQASCWDLKSGCSTGVLGLIQAYQWFNTGARSGILVCAENLSKFTPPDALQMMASTGDGAVALYLKANDAWPVRGIVHGTHGKYLKNMYVPGVYPIDQNRYDPSDYRFKFDQKSDTLKLLSDYWQSSLQGLLEASGITAKEVQHYIAHQVDGTKNKQFAQNLGIPDQAIAQNFKHFGNMGCPTVFINYLAWRAQGHTIKPGEHVLFHAVGGGLSWAGLCLQYQGA